MPCATADAGPAECRTIGSDCCTTRTLQRETCGAKATIASMLHPASYSTHPSGLAQQGQHFWLGRLGRLGTAGPSLWQIHLRGPLLDPDIA